MHHALLKSLILWLTPERVTESSKVHMRHTHTALLLKLATNAPKLRLSIQRCVDLPVQAPGSSSGLDCELRLSLMLPSPGGGSSGGKRRSGSGGGWVVCWQCSVLFTDDSARAEALRVGGLGFVPL